MIWVLLQSESPWQRNDAITLFIYLCNTVVVTFFSYLYSGRRSQSSNVGGIPPKKSSRATLSSKILFTMLLILEILYIKLLICICLLERMLLFFSNEFSVI